MTTDSMTTLPEKFPPRSKAPLLALAAAFTVQGCATPRFGAWDRAAPAAHPSQQTIGIVRIPIPWYAPRFVVRSRFRDAVPEYEAIPALDDKYYIISDDDRFGGIYVWRSRASAQSYYSEAWRKGIRESRGAEPNLLLLDVSTVIDGSARVEGTPLGKRSLSFPAYASVLLWKRGADNTGKLSSALADATVDLPGMIRAFVVTNATEVGLVTLWATRALAKAGSVSDRLKPLGPPAVTIHFEAPVLTDAEVRARRPAASSSRASATTRPEGVAAHPR